MNRDIWTGTFNSSTFPPPTSLPLHCPRIYLRVLAKSQEVGNKKGEIQNDNKHSLKSIPKRARENVKTPNMLLM